MSFIASKVADKRTKLKQKSCDFAIKSIFEEEQRLEYSQSQQDQEEKRVHGETKESNEDSESSGKGGKQKQRWEKIREDMNLFSDDGSAGNQTDHESVKAVVDYKGDEKHGQSNK